jgi:hypothetical protein
MAEITSSPRGLCISGQLPLHDWPGQTRVHGWPGRSQRRPTPVRWTSPITHSTQFPAVFVPRAFIDQIWLSTRAEWTPASINQLRGWLLASIRTFIPVIWRGGGGVLSVRRGEIRAMGQVENRRAFSAGIKTPGSGQVCGPPRRMSGAGAATGEAPANAATGIGAD